MPLENQVDAARMRLDKWLWAARMFKTRALAAEAAEQGRVVVNGTPAKPSREVRVGDCVELRRQDGTLRLTVNALSKVRGPASQAQGLYTEDPASQARRLEQAEQARLAREPAHAMARGRPTKRDRRQLAAWDRWSAVAED